MQTASAKLPAMSRTSLRSSCVRIAVVLARLGVIAAVVLAAAGSAAQNQGPPAVTTPTATAPAPQPMDASAALGLWRSSFGAVKIETDTSRGPGDNAVMGVWVYDRSGQEVVGYFAGILDGNVLQFTWQEPAEPAPLQGAGFLVFSPDGSRYSGRWWSDARDRNGVWTGWRPEIVPPQAPGLGGDSYGGATYGGALYGPESGRE